MVVVNFQLNIKFFKLIKKVEKKVSKWVKFFNFFLRKELNR
jgi:hypothetical protein